MRSRDGTLLFIVIICDFDNDFSKVGFFFEIAESIRRSGQRVISIDYWDNLAVDEKFCQELQIFFIVRFILEAIVRSSFLFGVQEFIPIAF